MTPPKHHLASTEGAAPGKAILLGEHFVVHGSAAIAVPLPGLRVLVRVQRDQRARPGDAEPRPGGHLGACLAIISESLGMDASELAVQVESSIPVGSGMGSSAALSVALARACAGARGLASDVARERELSMRCERLAHGRPSGIDTEVCVTGRPVWAEEGRFYPLSEGAGEGVGLVALHAGQGGATSEMVARVAAFREAHALRFQALVEATRERCHEARALLEGEAARPRGPVKPGALSRLGALLCAQHGALQEIGVSTPALDEVVAAACEEGAVGAKLSGAGGGGAVVAVAPLEATAALVARLRERGLEVVTSGPLL